MDETRYAARLLWLGPGRYHAPGELVVRDGRVVACRRLRGARVPPRAILPGLVDAHAHLQIPPLDRPERRFEQWVRAVMRARHAAGSGVHAQRAEAAVADLLAEGVTAVGEVDSTGASPAVLRQHRLAGTCYREVTGFHLGGRAAADLLSRTRAAGSRWCRAGWSPHAPYSVSPHLFRAVGRSGLPVAIHAAETEAEERFLRDGRGPFRDLLEELGRLPSGFRPPGVGAVAYLSALGVLGPRTTLIHAQHMAADEIPLVAASGSPVVVCPGTIRYFHRDPPAVDTWLGRGIQVALGTDSRASNSRRSLRHEMRLARRMWPALAPETVLGMATRAGGAAVGRPSVGRLEPGGPANFVSARIEAPVSARGLDDWLDRFTRGVVSIDGVWLRGSRWR